MTERTYYLVPYRKWGADPNETWSAGGWSKPTRYSSDEYPTLDAAMIKFRTQSRLDRQGKTLQFCVEQVDEKNIEIVKDDEIFTSVMTTRKLVVMASTAVYPTLDWVDWEYKVKGNLPMKSGLYLCLYEGMARQEDKEFAGLKDGFAGPAFGPLEEVDVTFDGLQVTMRFVDSADADRYPFVTNLEATTLDPERHVKGSRYGDLVRVSPGAPFEMCWEFNGMYYRGMMLTQVKNGNN